MKVWACVKQYKVVVMNENDGSYVHDFYNVQKAFLDEYEMIQFTNVDHTEEVYKKMNERFAMSYQVIYVNHEPRVKWNCYEVEK